MRSISPTALRRQAGGMTVKTILHNNTVEKFQTTNQKQTFQKIALFPKFQTTLNLNCLSRCQRTSLLLKSRNNKTMSTANTLSRCAVTLQLAKTLNRTWVILDSHNHSNPLFFAKKNQKILSEKNQIFISHPDHHEECLSKI